MRQVASCAHRALLAFALALGVCGGAPSAAESTQYTYDALGRVLSAIDQSGKKVVYTYDSLANRTRVSNGAEFTEIIPTALSASSNAGTTGLSNANGMRDGQFGALNSIHATQSEAGAWIRADLGTIKNVNHIEVAAAISASVGAAPEDLNDTAVEYSVDGTVWKAAATVNGAAPNASRTISVGGVAMRYLRIRRTVTGQVALGDLRLFSAAASNSPLIAEPDSITSLGVAVTFDPRVNDRDQDGHSFTISSVEDPPHGVAVVNAGASITYTPDTGYFGADSFLYSIADGHNGTASARISAVIQSSANHAPVAVADQFTVSDRATAVVDGINALRPLNNDHDADGDVLTITGTTAPTHGVLSVVGANLIEYQPTLAYSGADSFTYTISDGRGATATATVAVTTGNASPIASPDRIGSARGTPITFDPRLNDSDPNGDAFTVTSVTAPGAGAATLNPDQTVTYAPGQGAVGNDGFTYLITDARGATATGEVSVTVTPNTPPTALGDNIAASAAVTFDPRANDTDAENDSLAVVAVSAPAHGTASIDSVGGAVTYTPAAGYTGDDSFTYTVSDDEGATAIAVVAVNALNVDYLLVGGGGGGGNGSTGGGGGGGGLRAGSVVIAPTSLSVTVGAGGPGGGYPQETGGAGGASSLATLAPALGGGGGGGGNQPAGSGASGGGALGAGNRPGGSGTAGQGFNGGSSTFYMASGGGGGAGGAGQGSVSATQSGAGGLGRSSSISGASVIYGAGGGGGSYEVGAGAGGATSAGNGGQAAAGNAATANRGGGGGGDGGGYGGGAGGSGVVIVRYLGVPKATGGTITQVGGYTIHTFIGGETLTVTSANSIPIAVNDSIAAISGAAHFFDPRANDSDPNGDPLKVLSVSTPSHGTVAFHASGAPLSYMPATGFTGSDNFTYLVSDGATTATATVTVTVSAGGGLEYLVVAGGGGGGTEYNKRGGGGGGGGVRSGIIHLISGAHVITVGGGGAGAPANSPTPAGLGGDSSLGGLVTSLGGGRGASGNAVLASAGGSGGGASSGSPGAGTAGQGYAGGAARGSNAVGGGGGAGGVGQSAPSASLSGRGGPGVSNSITGANLMYGSGGGGGGISGGSAAGGADPGGGAGGLRVGATGAANLGGGGGGAGYDAQYGSGPGGNGGSGVVVVRYPTGAIIATGGTITTSGGYTIHTFTASGALTIP